MIQVILLLLKIIGIVLAVLLLTVLLVLALVLFVPVRYRARIIHNPEKDDIFGRASFLFPAVVFRFRYFEKVFSYQGRAFGIPFADSAKEKTGKNEKKQKSKKKDTVKVKDTVQETPVSTEPPEDRAEEKETQEILEKITPLKDVPVPLKTEETDRKKEKGPGFFEKVRNFIDGIVQMLSRLFRQKEELMRILEKPETKGAIRFAWDKLKKTILHIIPKKIKGYLIYGNADPATTGQILGVLGAVYAVTGPLVKIVPDFERERLECDLEFRGRLQIYTLLVILAKVYFNKELKQLIQEIKNIKEID